MNRLIAILAGATAALWVFAELICSEDVDVQ